MHENEISNKQFEIEQQIMFNESMSLRLMREAILGDRNALSKLQALDDSFSQLRTQRNNIGRKP